MATLNHPFTGSQRQKQIFPVSYQSFIHRQLPVQTAQNTGVWRAPRAKYFILDLGDFFLFDSRFFLSFAPNIL